MEKDLLDNLHEQYTFVLATQWQRLKNLLLDMFFSISFSTVLFIILMNLVPLGGLGSLGVIFLMNLPFFLYYFLFEAFNKGRTIGKMITSTQAVEKNGKPVSIQSAMLRTIMRIVPFEVFSGFGKECWHDTWTNTSVIQKKSVV